MTAVCLGGPTAFVVRAVHALLSTPGDAAVWPPYLWPMADAAEACAGGLEDLDGGGGVEGRGLGGVVAPFRRLLRARDEALGRREAYGSALSVSEEPWADVGLPRPDMPTAGEAAALLNKLVAGTPINAIDPPVPPDFLARLEGVSTPDLFYALIAPVGERPASLAAILGVGWLYKVRHSYPLFGRLLREHGDLGAALAAYRPHLLERGDLLAQSIEAAHVQGIFARGRREEAGIAARGGLDG